jgi:hypothetical protein
MTRWNLVVSEQTDQAVRRYLAAVGGKKDSLSCFVDDAFRQRVFDLTVAHVKNRNAASDQAELLALIDGETATARADRS